MQERAGTRRTGARRWVLVLGAVVIGASSLVMVAAPAAEAAVAPAEVTQRHGDDVVQLYIAVPASKIERAPRELKAFARVRLGPGETRTIALAVPISELAWYDSKAGWTVEPTEYQAIVAHHAHDPGLAASFEVVAQT